MTKSSNEEKFNVNGFFRTISINFSRKILKREILHSNPTEIYFPLSFSKQLICYINRHIILFNLIIISLLKHTQHCCRSILLIAFQTQRYTKFIQPNHFIQNNLQKLSKSIFQPTTIQLQAHTSMFKMFFEKCYY